MATAGVAITPENRGPIVNVISWILLSLTSLATLAKVWSKWSLTKKLQPDDFYMTAAMLGTAGWVIAVSMQVSAGLGRLLASISPHDVVIYQQAAYSSQFFYVSSLGLAKMAILHFLLSLARIKSRRLAVVGTMGFNILSMVMGLFAVAFQCPLPKPWEILSSQCIDQTNFWTIFGVLDIVVDIATAALPFLLLHDLRTKWQRKLLAITAFGVRFLLVPMIVVRLVYLRLNANSTNQPFDDFNAALVTSVQVNFSVIFTCLPFLKTVMDNIQTGLLSSNIHPGRSGSGSGYRTGKSGDFSPKRMMSICTDRANQGYGIDFSTTIREDSAGNQRGRAHSEASNERMVINQTTTISLKRDQMHGPFS